VPTVFLQSKKDLEKALKSQDMVLKELDKELEELQAENMFLKEIVGIKFFSTAILLQEHNLRLQRIEDQLNL